MLVRDRHQPSRRRPRLASPTHALLASPTHALLAAAAAAVLACVSRALVFPALSSNDEAAHVDYAVAIWQGRLPVFEHGLTIAPGFGELPPAQWVAQHPPLFYALLAPAVGPLADSGHYLAAVLAGRVVNSLLAGVAVLAVAWAVRQAAPGDPWLPPAAGVVTALCAWVLRVGGAVYNDVLGVVVASLLLGLAARTIRAGPTVRRWVALAVAGAAALATRASLALVLGVALAGVVLSVALVSRAVRPTVRSVLAAAATAVGAVLPTAWFWVRNVRLTGNVVGSHPEWAQENLDRVTRSWTDVLGDPGFWWQTWGLFSHNPDGLVLTTALLLVVPALAAGVVAARRLSRSRPDRTTLAVALVFAAATAGVALMAAGFTTTGGGINPRYVMPVLAPVVLVVVAGLRARPPAATPALAAWCAVAVVDAAVGYGRGVAEYLHASGTPPIWPVPAAVLGAAAVGCAAIAVVATGRAAADGGD